MTPAHTKGRWRPPTGGTRTGRMPSFPPPCDQLTGKLLEDTSHLQLRREDKHTCKSSSHFQSWRTCGNVSDALAGEVGSSPSLKAEHPSAKQDFKGKRISHCISFLEIHKITNEMQSPTFQGGVLGDPAAADAPG